MSVTIAFFRERKREICLYIVLLGTFALVSYLYNVRMDAVEYAFLLSAVWLLLSGIFDYIHYAKKHKRLTETEQGIGAEPVDLPEPETLPEEDYQKIIEKLDEVRIGAETAERISRQETADYYSMWVHQIKTPIAAMHVLMQAAPVSDQQYMKEMRLELFKIEQYVEMVLTYLRMEDMSSDLSFEICPLDAIVRQAVRKYSQMFILNKIKLEYTPIEMKVLTDEKWMVFVIEQLLSNALKYTQAKEKPSDRAGVAELPGGQAERGKISIYIEECLLEEETYENQSGGLDMDAAVSSKKSCRREKCLVIEDTGIGIWQEDLPRVFEKGFTGYNGRTDKKSTGIGLYLCKSVMDKLRHQIWIESEAGKGTKVYLYLGRKTMQYE